MALGEDVAEASTSALSGEALVEWEGVVQGTGSESTRLRFTCLCADREARFLLLGTTTGKLHVYSDTLKGRTRSYKFNRIVSVTEDEEKDKEGSALVDISYEEEADACAVASSSGRVHVVHLGLLEAQKAQKKPSLKGWNLKHERHKGRKLTQLAWVRARDGSLHLGTGDNEGRVFLLNVTAEVARVAKNQHTLFSSKIETGLQQMLKRGDKDKALSGEGRELHFDSPVVQLHSTSQGALVVSTKQASFLVDVGEGSSLQVGKKPRNGFYGCCLPPDLPDSDIFKALKEAARCSEESEKDSYLEAIYVAARPGRRLWVAVGSGVKGTMKLRMTPADVGGSTREGGPHGLRAIQSSEEGSLQLGQLFPYGKDLVSVSASAISIVNLGDCSLRNALGVPKESKGSMPRVCVLGKAGVIFLLDEKSSQVAMHDKFGLRGNLVQQAEPENSSSFEGVTSPSQSKELDVAGLRPPEEVPPRTTSVPELTEPIENKVENGEIAEGANGAREGAGKPASDPSPKENGGSLKDKESSVAEIPLFGESSTKPVVGGSLQKEDPSTKVPRPQLEIQTRPAAKHRRAKSAGLSRRKKSQVVEISVSKREEILGTSGSGSLGSDFSFSAVSSEQELNQLISNTISMTLESQKSGVKASQDKADASAPPAEEGAGKAEASKEDPEESLGDDYGPVSVAPEEAFQASDFLREHCRGISFEPWNSYFQEISVDEIRQALDSSSASKLSKQEKKQIEVQYRNVALKELEGAYRTLDASLVVFPLLQWLHLWSGMKEGGAPHSEEEGILLNACSELGLAKEGEVAISERVERAGEGDGSTKTGKGCAGSDAVEEFTAIVSGSFDESEGSMEAKLRRVLLSQPSDLWCSVFSGSLERILTLELPSLCEESSAAERLEKKLEVIFDMGWGLIGREFAFELMNQVVAHDDGSSLGLRAVVRALSHGMVRRQEKENAHERVAAEIFEMGSRASSGLGTTALEMSLKYDLSGSLDESSLREAEDALQETLRHHQGGGWGRVANSSECSTCGNFVQQTDNIVVFNGGEVYHERCCCEDAPVSKMPQVMPTL
ncbi:hypothetical protein A3770_01p06850 [Chloropicon primus]|uniref:Uncharacterized protein n=2 Tax=Chloropicon primus TaxID=1764295 RepID=A0A5B8MCF9_9CHLO|nr:hypothetical protein A3770_01p06850 [Chloropicon primus]|eukprot:QDZ18167.1 hypothetical protein A3770_01p06850 [Chloropicon primus]